MAIIYSYPKLSTLQGKDLLLISDVSSKSKPTMRVELNDITNFVNLQIISGGANNYLPVFTASGLSDSIIKQINSPATARVLGELNVDENLNVSLSAKINDQLAVGGNLNNIPQSNFSAPGINAVKSTPGSTDTSRPGVVFIGGFSGSYTGNFTQFDHALNLHTANNFSDPTNFSDAKAFEYTYNDGYKFARIQAEDYAGGNINPMWEVGDFGETTNARWQVNSGGFARYYDGSTEFFKVTSDGVSMEVILPNNFPNDVSAGFGGVPVGGLYHTAGVVKIRLT